MRIADQFDVMVRADSHWSARPGQRVSLFDVRAQNESIRQELEPAISAVFRQGAFIGGPAVTGFESAFRAFCRTEHCVGVANGTDALFLALRGFGIGAGDEVITTACSFVATAQAVVRSGAAVRFVDIEPATCNIDPDRIAEQITPRTRAIIPVHLFGQPADMGAILRIARRHDLIVIEDAAQAHGALDGNRVVGSLGDAACFSFYPTKNLGACGDGGAIVTNDGGVAETVRRLTHHAARGAGDYGSDGTNSRLDAFQAAILQVKLRHLDRWNRRRRGIARLYEQCLSGLEIQLPVERPGSASVFHVYPIRVAGGRRDELQQYLAAGGIETRTYYPRPLPYVTGFSAGRTDRESFPEAVRASLENLALPCHPELTDSAAEFVAGRVRAFLEGS